MATAPSSTDAFQRFNNLENLGIKDTNASTMHNTNNTIFKVPMEEKDIIPELELEDSAVKIKEKDDKISNKEDEVAKN